MSSGENAVDEIQRDLACPQCQYNLRGLRGDIVACPECGVRCDVAKLIAMRWEKAWYLAPLFYVLAIPAGWIVFCFFILLPVNAAVWFTGALPVWTGVGCILITIIGWSWAMSYVAKRWGSAQGVRLALVAHWVVLGYIIGIGGLLPSCVLVCRAAAELATASRNSGSAASIGLLTRLLLLSALLALVYCCRRGERYLARQCIRRYVAGTARVDEPGPNAG